MSPIDPNGRFVDSASAMGRTGRPATGREPSLPGWRGGGLTIEVDHERASGGTCVVRITGKRGNAFLLPPRKQRQALAPFSPFDDPDRVRLLVLTLKLAAEHVHRGRRPG